MQEKRYLCSDLMQIRGTGGWSGWANLEEIWTTGAVLDSEIAIPVGEKLLLRKGKSKLWAEVLVSERQEFGFRTELKFIFDYVWSKEKFEPDHLLDPASVGS